MATVGSPIESPGDATIAVPGGVVIEVTPAGAFATAMLAVSALALAFALGSRVPRDPTPAIETSDADIPTLEQVRSRPPVLYHELNIDNGEAR